MHPILHLAPQRTPEYHRGLAHGLTLAADQLRQLAQGHAFLPPSSIMALARRLTAIGDTVRREAWTEAHQLFQHEIAPPMSTGERPVHRPVIGRDAEKNGHHHRSR